jgi:hypothetical protein
MASERQATADLDWGQATVRGGKLELPLTHKASKRWVKEITSILDRLDPRAGVEVGRENVTVAVEQGEEQNVRHLLESAVLEANSRLTVDEDGGDDEPGEEDVSMTATFRTFGSEDADSR